MHFALVILEVNGPPQLYTATNDNFITKISFYMMVFLFNTPEYEVYFLHQALHNQLSNHKQYQLM